MTDVSLANGILAFSLPDSWEDRSLYTFIAPERKIGSNLPTMAASRGFRPNIVVGRMAADAEAHLEEFANEQIKGAQRDLQQFKLIEKLEKPLGTQPALWLTYTFVAPPSQTTVQCLQVLTHTGGAFFTITCSSLPALFTEDLPQFEAVLNSARWQE